MYSFRLCTCLATALLAGSLCAQTKGLTIGTAEKNQPVPITMTSDQGVEGFVLAVRYDAALAATDVRAAGATVAKDAELVVAELLAGAFTLGVVMDFDPPYDGQVIDAGTNVLIAEAEFSVDDAALALDPGESIDLPVYFQDDLNDPPLDSILVVGGLSFSQAEGLALANGSVHVAGKGDDIRIVSATGAMNSLSVPVSVVAENKKPLEGYVLSIGHPTLLTLEAITVPGEMDLAEFVVKKFYADGGTVGVVLDFEPPYDGQTIPAGTNELAAFTYSKAPVTCNVPTSETFDLAFVDGVFGTPKLSNVLVEEGLSIPPSPTNGTVTFRCEPTNGDSHIWFFAGGEVSADASPADLECATGSAGAEVKVVFYYTAQNVPIQGISMAVKFDLPLQVADLDGTGQGIVGADHIAGTITKGINAEFVSFNADNAAGELVIGILVDSTPPVPINHMYPPTDTLGKVLNIFFAIPEGVACDTELGVRFVNPAYAAGDVPIFNRVAVFNESYPANFDNSVGGCVRVGGDAKFIRGDCNTDQWVDIADPAATMSYLFLGVYAPECLDACDSNDDGVVDLADTVSTLRFLFKLGPILPAPGPYVAGYDPTPDIYGLDLGCSAGDPCS